MGATAWEAEMYSDVSEDTCFARIVQEPEQAVCTAGLFCSPIDCFYMNCENY